SKGVTAGIATSIVVLSLAILTIGGRLLVRRRRRHKSDPPPFVVEKVELDGEGKPGTVRKGGELDGGRVDPELEGNAVDAQELEASSGGEASAGGPGDGREVESPNGIAELRGRP